MRFDRNSLLLYAVTDRAWTEKNSLIQQIEASLKGGVTCLQLREKGLPFPAFLTESIAVKELCHQYRVSFIVNDSLEIALQSDADGLHIGQSDISVKKARTMIGKDKILGVSAQTVDQALLAQQDGADYLGVGAVFATSTKQDADAVSLETLKTICQTVKIPVVAIGGISKDNMPNLRGSGIAGVALVSAIFAQDDIAGTCENLLLVAKEICC